MSRAYYLDGLIDRSTGESLQGASVTVLEHGASTPLIADLYGDPTDPTPIANPLTTDAEGTVALWLAAGQRVDLRITYPGAAERTVTADIGWAPEDVATLTTTQELSHKTLSDSLWDGGLIQDAVWDGGTIANAAIQNQLAWPSGWDGGLIQSLAHALANPLGVTGGAASQGIAIQRGAGGIAAADNVPWINEQYTVNPNGAAGTTGNVFYRLVHRVGAGNQYALYSNLFHLIAEGTSTVFGGGTDNVSLAAIAENVAGSPARIWAFYPEIRAYSATASAIAIENDAWNGTGVAAGQPWRDEAPSIVNYTAVADADALAVDGSKYISEGYGIWGRTSHFGVAPQRGAHRVGLMAHRDSIRISGSDAGLSTRVAPTVGHPEGEAVAYDAGEEIEDISGGYFLHAALLDPSTRFGLMGNGAGLYAVPVGWAPVTNDDYTDELRLIGTEEGSNHTYIYGPGDAIVFAPQETPGTLWGRITADAFTIGLGHALGFAADDSMAAIDVELHRLGADVLAQYRGTNPQRFFLYATVDGSDYERCGWYFADGEFTFSAEYGGAGVARPIGFATSGAVQWQIDTSGILHTTNARRGQFKQPTAIVSNAAFSHNSSGNFLPLTFDTELLDQDGQGGAAALHSLVTNTDLLVPCVAGVWAVDAYAGITSNASGVRIMELHHVTAGGTVTTIASQGPQLGNSGIDGRLTVSRTYPAALGDYFRVAVYQDSGSTLAIVCRASLHYVGD